MNVKEIKELGVIKKELEKNNLLTNEVKPNE